MRHHHKNPIYRLQLWFLQKVQSSWPRRSEERRVAVTASIATVKLLLNSVVSTKGENFTTADIQDFFYASFLPDPEYMNMKLKIITQEIIDQYQLQDLEKMDGFT